MSENLYYLKVTKKNKIHFKKEGYLFLRKSIQVKVINQILRIIIENLKLYLNKKSINKKNFHKYLLLLRKKNKKKFGRFFDGLQTTSLSYSLLTDSKIISLISKLLGTKSSSLTFTDISLRLDGPNDKRNSLKWHQDSSYFRQSSDGKNGVVLWIPLESVNYEKGPIELLKNSDKIGSLFVKKQKSKNKFYSAQREISQNKLKKFKKIIKKKVFVGDAVLTNLDLVHRSGKNTSKFFRISLIGRFHNMLKKGFNSGLNKYIYTDKKINQSVHGKI